MMSPARLSLLSSVRTATVEASHNVSRTPGVQRLFTARQGPLMMQRRDYHLAVVPTRIDARGKVTDPGHIQIQTTPKEQRKYGVAPVYGHSRDIRQPTTGHHQVSGTLPDGKEFSVKGVLGPGKKATDDKMLTGDSVIRIDMGELSHEEAERLKQFSDRQIFAQYEVSGDLGTNCVHGVKKVVETIHQAQLSVHKHETPQGAGKSLAEQLLDQRHQL